MPPTTGIDESFPAPTALSLVIPCYNEESVLPLLEERLVTFLGTLNLTWEVLLVDDGSVDRTAELLTLMHGRDPRFKIVRLSRNFGHQAAICAGLAHTRGAAVGIMDADLQDPPEILVEALDRLNQGYDVVYAVRRKRKEGIFKRAAYSLFYRILTAISDISIPLDAGDFCLMRRKVTDVLTRLPERNVFLRGLRAWTGFRQIGLEYERAARQAGEPKYSLRKLIGLAADGVFSFSTTPLRLATYLGVLAVLFSGCAGLFVLVWRVTGFRVFGYTAHELPGWAGVADALFLLSGLQFVILGVLGEYVGRIYTEVKQRPRWIVGETLGLPARTARDEASE